MNWDEILKHYPEINAIHPAADLFPLLPEAEFELLVEDIKRRGLSVPIILSNAGDLLDGRNRLLACHKAMQEVIFTTYQGDEPFEMVASLNLHRRHLTVQQQALVAARIKRHIQEREPVGTRHSGGKGKARERAATVTGVSPRSVENADAVLDHADLTAQVQAGEKGLEQAAKEARARAPKPTPQPAQQQEMLTLVTDQGEEVLYPKPQSASTFNKQSEKEIGWAMFSWNPVTGCRHTCSYCYARHLATQPGMRATYPVGFTPLFHHERLEAPSRTRIPVEAQEDSAFKRVFVCSMADLFGAWVPQEWIDRVVAATVANPQWEYLFLTKYPQRYDRLALPRSGWMGTTIDSQQAVKPALAAMRKVQGVKVKWLSLEPLLEPVRLDPEELEGIDWMVIGAQSANTGQNEAFAPDFNWVVDLVTTARQAGVKVWLKHNLLGKVDQNLPGMILPNELP